MKGCVCCQSYAWEVSVTSPAVAKPGKEFCHVRAPFLVSDDSLGAGKLMAAKFAL